METTYTIAPYSGDYKSLDSAIKAMIAAFVMENGEKKLREIEAKCDLKFYSVWRTFSSEPNKVYVYNRMVKNGELEEYKETFSDHNILSPIFS